MTTMSTLEEWMTTVRAELALAGDGVADLRVVQKVVLDLARDEAHGVARPAAPLTAYLLGVAVGRAGVAVSGAGVAVSGAGDAVGRAADAASRVGDAVTRVGDAGGAG